MFDSSLVTRETGVVLQLSHLPGAREPFRGGGRDRQQEEDKAQELSSHGVLKGLNRKPHRRPIPSIPQIRPHARSTRSRERIFLNGRSRWTSSGL